MAKKKIFSSWSSFRTNKVEDEGWRGKWSWRINLDEVLEKDNYVDPESQLDLTYEYSDAKKTVNITAQTVTEKKSKKKDCCKYSEEKTRFQSSREVCQNTLGSILVVLPWWNDRKHCKSYKCSD